MFALAAAISIPVNPLLLAIATPYPVTCSKRRPLRRVHVLQRPQLSDEQGELNTN
jgi:hypothetical protein